MGPDTQASNRLAGISPEFNISAIIPRSKDQCSTSRPVPMLDHFLQYRKEALLKLMKFIDDGQQSHLLFSVNCEL